MNIVKMNMNVVIFLISIAITGFCIELNLPLDPQLEDQFEIDEIHTDYPFAEDVFGVTCYDTFYESKDGQVITRVLFKGFELFKDKVPREPPFKRIVSYSYVSGRTYITVFQQGELSNYEAAYYIANGHLYNLLKIKQLIDNEEFLISGKTPGRFISKMIRLLPSEINTEDDPSTSEETASSVPRPRVIVKRKHIELDIDTILERRLVGRYGIYSSRRRDRSRRARRRQRMRTRQQIPETESD